MATAAETAASRVCPHISSNNRWAVDILVADLMVDQVDPWAADLAVPTVCLECLRMDSMAVCIKDHHILMAHRHTRNHTHGAVADPVLLQGCILEIVEELDPFHQTVVDLGMGATVVAHLLRAKRAKWETA